jgi:hypothetical protein
MELEPNKLKEKIHKLIEEHLPAKEKEKSELGEVFTPVSMIETLYERFPKSVWKNPSYTWLDPASGIGNFPLVLYFWLMEGLSSKIPNKTKRAKHIIENMIYMVEINPQNVSTCKKIFKKVCPEATPNIHQGDFLKLDAKSLKWPEKYDAIIGNPPYNIGGTGLEGSKRTHIVFTEVGLDRLSKNGYLAYICPPSYREAETPMNELFQKAGGHFVFIKIYGAQETFKLFHIQGRVDGFIYQKDAKGTTIVDDEYGIVTTGLKLNLDRHIPNFGHTIFDKLYAKVDKLGHVEAFRSTEMSSVKATSFGCNGKHKILHLILSKGKRVFRSNKAHSLESTPKILINGLGVPYVYYDAKGEYGPSQSPVIILKPSRNLVNLLESDVFSFIAWGLRLTGNNNLPYLFDAVPNVGKESNKYSTMTEIKKGLGLTAEEVKFIEDHFHKYEYKDVDIFEKCVRNKTLKKKK